MQEHPGGASVQSLLRTTKLCMLLSVAVIAVSIVCYTVCNHVCSNRAELGVLDELLLQEEDSELITMKFSQEWSSMTYKMFITVSLAVVGGLCAYYIVQMVQSTNEEAQWKQAFWEMYTSYRNLERQLNAEMRANTSQHKADNNSLRRRHEQELFTADERHREKIANQKEKVADLQSKLRKSQRNVSSLQHKCEHLENQLQRERNQKEELKAKLMSIPCTPPESKKWCSRFVKIGGKNRSIPCVIF